jgi:hypothetical protein
MGADSGGGGIGQWWDDFTSGKIKRNNDATIAKDQAAKGKGGPAPQDYQAINQEQIAANRPNQSTPYGSSSWHKDANGNWTQTTEFNGQLGDAFKNLSGQFASATSSPLDFSGAPALQYGEDARKAATDASYRQETSRLDPMWSQREGAERQRLIGQGLDPDSEAYKNSMGDFGRQRNDAYQGAINNSIGLGQSAAGQMFDQSAMAHQMGIADILRKRNQPLQELGQMQGMLQMPGFNQATGGVEAARLKDAAEHQRSQDQQGGMNDMLSGLLSLGGTLIGGPAGGAAGGLASKLLGKGKGSGGPAEYGSSGRIGAGEL